MTSAVCSVEGCDRPAKSRGYCQTHYMRWWVHGDPGSAEIKTYEPRGVICKVDGCGKPVQSIGFCGMHYERNRKYGDPLHEGPGRGSRQRKWKGKTCSIEGCERPAHLRGWCRLHYGRWQTKGDPGPAGLLIAPPGSGYVDSNGYRVFNIGGRNVAEHRLVMEQMLGRQLTGDENVHHINGDRADNRPENLELWVTAQPPRQNVEDLVAWARQILSDYEGDVEQLQLFHAFRKRKRTTTRT